MKKLTTVFLLIVFFVVLFRVDVIADDGQAPDSQYFASGTVSSPGPPDTNQPVSFASDEVEPAPSDFLITQSENGLCMSAYMLEKYEYVAEGSLMTLLSIAGGGSFSFCGVNINEPIEIPGGSFTFSGSFGMSANLTVPRGSSLILTGTNLHFSAGSLRIKGGDLIIRDSTVTSDAASAVVLDYSAYSYFRLVSGEIRSLSDSPALDVRYGTAEILSGTIESDGFAVVNDSSLVLSRTASINGSPSDVYTERPITLGGDAVDGFSMRISFPKRFERGTLTEIVYSADEDDLRSITLYDASGRECPLTYFSEYPGRDEGCFAGVYLPYSIRYYSNGSLLRTDLMLTGEIPTPPTIPEIKGYTFSGWITEQGDAADQTAVCGDFDFYAEYHLLPPELTVSSLEFTYDGAPRELRFDTLAHPLDSDGGRYSFSWRKNGEEILCGATVPVISVTDSGEYSCEVTFYHSSYSVSVSVQGISISVLPRVISVPKIDSLTYTGLPILPEIYSNSIYSVEVQPAVVAGSYPIIFSLKDPVNNIFEGGNTESTVFFEICRAENKWTEEITVWNQYAGAQASPSSSALFGTPRYEYSTEENGEYSAEFPTIPGRYFVVSIVDGCENYEGLRSLPLPFSILEEQAVSLSILQAPTRTDYFAFEKFMPEGILLEVVYNSGRKAEIGVDEITVAYQRGDCFLYGDDGVAVEYGGVVLKIPVNVRRAEYDLSSFSFTDSIVTYSGRFMTVEPVFEPIVGSDGIPLCFSVEGGGRDAGEYLVTLLFSTDSLNYLLPESLTAKLTITPLCVEIIWQNCEFSYDGKPKSPSATYIDVFGAAQKAEVRGSATEAGTGYVATVSGTRNYFFTNSECTFNIAKATFDLSGVKWSGTSFIYDGTRHAVTISGLPDGLLVIGYTDNKATDSGEYSAQAILSYDLDNYESPEIAPLSWVILPASYDMSGITLEAVVAEYDGEEHLPILNGSLPIGIDGSSPGFSFSPGAIHVSEGIVTVTLTFTAGSKNYRAPDPMESTVSITPKGITVLWEHLELVYCGSYLCPSACAAECEILVNGGAVNAGEYTAIASPENSDYYVMNSEIKFIVKRAENGWITEPGPIFVYEGYPVFSSASPISGSPELIFYSDVECTNLISAPSAPGFYYFRVSVPETDNYEAIISAPLSLVISEVVPVSLSVTVTAESLTAFSVLSSTDFIATLIFNDGSIRSVEGDLITVDYGNFTSLRVNENQVAFHYLDMTAICEVSVLKADYDMGSVCWTGLDNTYDGSPKLPELKGLPDGVSVLSYSSDPAVCAGEYTFIAELSYDKVNYNSPPEQKCVLTIRKRTVSIPHSPVVEYDGLSHFAMTSSQLYVFVGNREHVNAGSYPFSVVLIDPENCVFEDGSTSCDLTFTIQPRILEFTVHDCDLYLWEALPTVGSTLLSGSIISGEDPRIEQYSEDGFIYLRSTNPNYELKINPGKINYLPYPTPDTSAKIVIICILLMALILLCLLIYSSRERLLDLLSIFAYRVTRFFKALTAAPSVKHPSDSPGKTKWLDVSISSRINDEGRLPSESDLIVPTRASDEVERTNTASFGELVEIESSTCYTSPENMLASIEEIKNGSDAKAAESEAALIEEHLTEDGSAEKTASTDSAHLTSKSGNHSTKQEEKRDNATQKPIISSTAYLPEEYEEAQSVWNKKALEPVKEVLTSDIPSQNGSTLDQFTDAFATVSFKKSKVKTTNADPVTHEILSPIIDSTSVDMEKANSLITDSLAKDLIKKGRDIVITKGRGRAIINVDTLSKSFKSGDRVDVNSLKRKGLVGEDISRLKILARGSINKSLIVYANEFSLAAVKMLALTGGEAVKVYTLREGREEKQQHKGEPS